MEPYIEHGIVKTCYFLKIVVNKSDVKHKKHSHFANMDWNAQRAEKLYCLVHTYMSAQMKQVKTKCSGSD